MLCSGQSGYYDFTVVRKQHLSSSISRPGQASIDELDPKNAEILAQFKVTIEFQAESDGPGCMMIFCHSCGGKSALVRSGSPNVLAVFEQHLRPAGTLS